MKRISHFTQLYYNTISGSVTDANAETTRGGGTEEFSTGCFFFWPSVIQTFIITHSLKQKLLVETRLHFITEQESRLK
jgi:hypothetical protein